MTVYLIRGLGPDRVRAEQEVASAGIPLPISHRAAWAENFYRNEPWFLLVKDAQGSTCAGAAIEQVRTRSMPGFRILRLRRFGEKVPQEVCAVILDALNSLVNTTPRVLRVHVGVFSRNRRHEIGEALASRDYRELVPPNVYRHTLTLDLGPTEDEIFATVNGSGRNNIRKIIRASGNSQAITDPIYADRMRELQQAALDRTRGHIAGDDWRAVLKLSKDHPDLSQVYAKFFSEDTSPENMAAFGWVVRHGDHGEYRAAGSMRRADVKTPFGYVIVWDMIRWSKSVGAEWFDMGGVTVSQGDETNLEGISNFKKSFSRAIEEVGAEWIMEPSPLQARIADAVSKGAMRLRGFRTGS